MMIVKTFICTLLLLVVYAFCLKVFPYKNKNEGQNQWQDNIIKAQQYIYDSSGANNVIVGSSLSCRLDEDILSKNFYNLSFGGQSIFDGIELLIHAKTKPRRVFVEMNMVKRSADSSFNKSLFNPVLFPLKRELEVMREKNQPTNYVNISIPFLGHKIYDPFIARIVNPILNKINPFKKNDDNLIKSQSSFKVELINRHKQEFDIPLNETLINNRVKVLIEKVHLLQRKGVQVVFFEMPLDSSLENTVQMNAIRKLFHQKFPEQEYFYLSRPNYSEYSTMDGLHLDKESAKKFTFFFVEDVTRRMSKL